MHEEDDNTYLIFLKLILMIVSSFQLMIDYRFSR